MSQPKRINKSLREVTAIWRAIQNGDPDLAERCCVDHVRAAAVARAQHDRTIIRTAGKSDHGLIKIFGKPARRIGKLQ